MSKRRDNALSAGYKGVADTSVSIRSFTLRDFPDKQVERAWREFLARTDFATHYISPEYFLEPFFPKEKLFVILTMDDSRVVGVISGMHEDGSVQCGLCGRPQVAFDPKSDGAVFESALKQLHLEAVDSNLATIFSWVQLPYFASAGYSEAVDGRVIVLDLTVPEEVLLRQFSKGRRSDIASAQRKGVYVQVATTQNQFEEYYRIYSDWCRRKNLDAVPFTVLNNALHLQSNRKLFLAYFKGRAIAGSIIRYVPGGVAEYSANSSLDETLALRPNSLLVWSAIQWASQQGLQKFSMGGEHPFLQHFGGTGFPQYRYSQDFTFLKLHERFDLLRRGIRKVRSEIRNSLRSRRS